jgi:hypothetical protein
MGHFVSRPAEEEDPLARKRREIKERGVLIPPSFGVVSVAPGSNGPDSDKNASGGGVDDDDVPLSSGLWNLQSRLVANQLVPSLLSDLSARDLSSRILNDYMQAGFWLSTSTSSSVAPNDDEADDAPTRSPTSSSRSSTTVKAGFQISDEGSASDRRQGGLGNAWSSSSKSLMSNGLVSLRHSSSPDNRLQTRVCVGTDAVAAPSATVAYHLLSPAASSSNQLVVMGHGSALGTGWVGAHWTVASIRRSSSSSSSSSTPLLGNVRLGSWAAVTGSLVAKKRGQGHKLLIEPRDSQSSSASTITSLSRLGRAVDSVGAYAAADFLGSTAAFQVQGRLPSPDAGPSSSMPQLQTRTYFSINLADDHHRSKAAGSGSPPLVVTLERSGGNDTGRYYSSDSSGEVVSSMSLSQVLHLDRYQVNPLEDRAPKIRNTLGWTIRLERVAAASAPYSSSNSGPFLSHDEAYSATTVATTTSTRLAVGGAWQINRAVAVKAVANPDAFTAALILRRWKEPRVTCSLLFRNQLNQDGFGLSSPSSSSAWRPRFVGVGLQVETGDQLYHGGSYHYADQRKVPFGASGASSPETKATLPQ